MNKQEIWIDVCDECLDCKNYWKNNDTETECEGEEKPCHEYSRLEGKDE